MGPASSIAVSTEWRRVRAQRRKLCGKWGLSAANNWAEVKKMTFFLHICGAGVGVFGVMLLYVVPQWAFLGPVLLTCSGFS